MKNWLAVLVLGGVTVMGPAAAGSYRGGFYVQDKGGFAYSKDQGKRYVRESRPPRVEPSGKRGSGRLTDDERQQLRRDLDKANRELYRGRRER